MSGLNHAKLIEYLPEAILIHRAGRIEYANRAALALFGATTLSQLYHQPLEHLVHPRHRDLLNEHLHKLNEQALLQAFIDTRLLWLDGGDFYAEISSACMPDDDGPLIQSIIRDIDGRKRAEAALIEANRAYRIVADFTYDWEYWELPGGSLRYVSPSCQRITGYTAEEFIDNPGLLLDITHPDDRYLWDDHKHDEGQTLSLREVQFRIITKEGHLRWIEHACRAVVEPDGHYLGFRISNRDVTRRKLLEDKLLEHSQRLEQMVEERTAEVRTAKEQIEVILEHTHDAVALVLANGDVQLANPAFKAMFEDTAAETVERILWSVADTDSLENVARSLVSAIWENQQVMLATRVQSPDGPARDIDLTMVPIEGQTGLRESIVISAHDITHHKELERLKARFVANAVHDLTTPITGLALRLHLLRQSPGEVDKHLTSLEAQVKHLQHLLDDLRTLSRLDRGKIELARDLANINSIVQRVFDTYEPVALAHEQAIHLALDLDLPMVWVDERQVERVVVNLVSNAVHYTPSGKAIHLQTGLANGLVMIEVRDEGIGIPAKDLPHVFERFYRSDEARLTRVGGTGLGLAIVKEVVELHGGRVGVKSEVGEGSRFWVCLPVR
jgi:PAS domain S-box-containing protein